MDGNGPASRVLIVDTDHVIADTLAMILSQNGFEASAVYSDDRALETAVVLHPDVLITDVILGAANGIDLAIRIKKLVRDCRVILISGSPSAADMLHDAEKQGHHFEILAKPIHPSDLIDRLIQSSGSIHE